MPVKINGLPAHILLVHAVVVLVPIAALLVVLHAVWPTARRRLGIVTPLVSLIALALVPVTTNAGEWLEDRLPEREAIRHHADLGNTLLWFMLPLFAISVGVWWLGRQYDMSWRPPAEPRDDDAPTRSGGTATLTRPAPARTALPVWVTTVVAVVAVAMSTATTIQLVRIGDSGSQSVWKGTADLPARHRG